MLTKSQVGSFLKAMSENGDESVDDVTLDNMKVFADAHNVALEDVVEFCEIFSDSPYTSNEESPRHLEGEAKEMVYEQYKDWLHDNRGKLFKEFVIEKHGENQYDEFKETESMIQHFSNDDYADEEDSEETFNKMTDLPAQFTKWLANNNAPARKEGDRKLYDTNQVENALRNYGQKYKAFADDEYADEDNYCGSRFCGGRSMSTMSDEYADDEFAVDLKKKSKFSRNEFGCDEYSDMDPRVRRVKRFCGTSNYADDEDFAVDLKKKLTNKKFSDDETFPPMKMRSVEECDELLEQIKRIKPGNNDDAEEIELFIEDYGRIRKTKNRNDIAEWCMDAEAFIDRIKKGKYAYGSHFAEEEYAVDLKKKSKFSDDEFAVDLKKSPTYGKNFAEEEYAVDLKKPNKKFCGTSDFAVDLKKKSKFSDDEDLGDNKEGKILKRLPEETTESTNTESTEVKKEEFSGDEEFAYLNQYI